jgi:hypothetical protein
MGLSFCYYTSDSWNTCHTVVLGGGVGDAGIRILKLAVRGRWLGSYTPQTLFPGDARLCALNRLRWALDPVCMLWGKRNLSVTWRDRT